MSTPIEIRLPDIGDFTGVPVIEVHVAPGDAVAVDDPILTLESDKATMDIPAPQAGTVRELRVGVGDEVSQGDLLLTLEPAGAGGGPAEGGGTGGAAQEHVTEAATPAAGEPAGYGSPAGVYERLEVRVPDIGEFENVPVIEVLVAAGDTVAAEDPLLTLESDKATMDIPAPAGGTVAGVRVGVGDTVSEGDVIIELQTGQAVDEPTPSSVPLAAVGAGRPGPHPRLRRGHRGRRPGRGAGARGRARRLQRRLPGRRPGQVGRAGGRLPDPGRGLPQRRLHPLQGPAPRGQGDRRDQGDGRARPDFS